MEKENVLALRECLNPESEAITVEPFRTGRKFFDPADNVQVKYEILRAVQLKGLRITQAPQRFGYSRETYYTVLRRFSAEGGVWVFLIMLQG